MEIDLDCQRWVIFIFNSWYLTEFLYVSHAYGIRTVFSIRKSCVFYNIKRKIRHFKWSIIKFIHKIAPKVCISSMSYLIIFFFLLLCYWKWWKIMLKIQCIILLNPKIVMTSELKRTYVGKWILFKSMKIFLVSV